MALCIRLTGSQASEYSFWNYERLTQYAGLTEVDTYSVIDALAKLSKLIQ